MKRIRPTLSQGVTDYIEDYFKEILKKMRKNGIPLTDIYGKKRAENFSLGEKTEVVIFELSDERSDLLLKLHLCENERNELIYLREEFNDSPWIKRVFHIFFGGKV